MQNIDMSASSGQSARGSTKVDNPLICYLLFATYALWLWAIAQKQLYETDLKIAPQGDAFQYTVFFYQILNQAREDFASAASLILTKNYNWLEDFLTLFFSPALFKERSSLILINYFCFLFGTVLIFRTARRCNVPQLGAFCTALLFAALPWHFNAHMEYNLTSLMPDPIFMMAYLCAGLLLAWLISDPHSTPTAIACGLALGAAVWSRWNAFVYVAMLLAGVGLVVLIRLVFAKKRPDGLILANCAVTVLIVLIMTSVYFWFMHAAIFGYGSDVAQSLPFDLPRMIAGSRWLLLNMPGLAIPGQWFYPNTLVTAPGTIARTVFAHALVIYAIFLGVRKIMLNERREVLIGSLGLIGATVFYLDLLLALCAFSAYYSNPAIFSDEHSLAPGIVGLVCCGISVMCALLARRVPPALNHALAYILITAVVALNSTNIIISSFASIREAASWNSSAIGEPATKAQCARANSSGTYLSNEELKAFSLRFRDAAAGRFAYFFWSGIFNQQIVDYYAAQAGLSPLRLVPQRSALDRSIWDATFHPEATTPEPWFREFLKYIFATADYVVIPERVDSFADIWPSPIVAYHDDIVAALNSPEIAPDYLVWGVIDDEGDRILILKKRGSDDTAGFAPFPRTWGTSAQVIGRSFEGAVVAVQEPRWKVDGDASPEPLFAYRGYNIVRVGQLYLGVARALGPTDIPAILAGTVPRPPATAFIFAHTIGSLERKISVCGENASGGLLRQILRELPVLGRYGP
jgi:hypothetical protein